MPPRVVPRVGMRAMVEEFAISVPALIVEVADGGRRVVVECEREERVFTLRTLTAHYVEEAQPYYGSRLRLIDGP